MLLFLLLAACAPSVKGTACDAVNGWRDADGDGFGAGDPVAACTGVVGNSDDCDDADAAIHPGAGERCEGTDDDCDGVASAGVVQTWYTDADADGYGDPLDPHTTCEPESEWTLDGSDCAPADPAVHPGAAESCNDADDNCDGEVDEGLDVDADGDGYEATTCVGGTDCDDGDPTISPGAADTCDDGIDANCDGRDPSCGLGGDYDLGAADGKVFAPANYGLGSFIETGDLTGDGIDDALVASMLANGGNGGGYVLPGPITGIEAADSVGYFLAGTAEYNGAGRSIGIGDVDGDGFLDVSFGSPYDSEGNGTWILFGPFDADRNLVDDHDVYLRGPWGSMAGHGGDLADLNADGVDDALVGCWSDGTGAEDGGGVFVKYGPLAAGDVDLETDADAHLIGESTNAESGRVTRGGVDLDGDGIGDLIALAPGVSIGVPSRGAAYVVYGPPMGDLDLSAADGRLLGATPNEYLGWNAALGDVDGDGLGDVVVTSTSDGAASNAGALYVFYGPASGDIAASSADIVVQGVAADQYFGAGVATSDIDHDGFSDVLAGAVFDATAGVDSGAAYLFLSPASGSYTTADADACFHGEASGDWTGQSTAVGDLDGDGWGDLLIGATQEDSGGSYSGALYVQYSAF